MRNTYQSDVGIIKSVVVKHARDAFVGDDAIDAQWQKLGYVDRPDFDRAAGESDGFIELLRSFGAETRLLPADDCVGLDSIYVRDAIIVCDNGAILCNMGKAARRTEPDAVKTVFEEWGIEICGAIEGDGRVEGGDVAWIDERTLAVGRGYRTNDEGFRQLRGLLRDSVDEVIVTGLPHWRGPGDVFHLMSIFSPIDQDLAVVYSPLLPVPFREALVSRGVGLIEVPDAEFDTMGCNVLAVAPRKCVMVPENPRTRERLEDAGAEVYEYPGTEISRKGLGGPTCLTRPLLRGLP